MEAVHSVSCRGSSADSADTGDFGDSDREGSEILVMGRIKTDSALLADVVGAEHEELFEKVRDEVSWSEMFHKGGAVPRLVSIQGELQEIHFPPQVVLCEEPVYRHPVDEQPPLRPFSPTVLKIRDAVVDRLRQHYRLEDHHLIGFNHILIQLYRSGNDYISEHADKTLDIAHHSPIVNVSLGATRTMILRPKKGQRAGASADTLLEGRNQNNAGDSVSATNARVRLVHNSMFVLGWNTNRECTHEIRRDKRMSSDKVSDELAFNSVRISLTFRNIATYLLHEKHVESTCFPNRSGVEASVNGRDSPLQNPEFVLYGQGATQRTRPAITSYEDWRRCLLHAQLHRTSEVENGDESAETLLLKSFSDENRSTVDWATLYGRGFDVLNFSILNKKPISS
jgi:2OG-Fe(II) oxygenase superfamily